MKDYSNITLSELVNKKNLIFESLGRTGGFCEGIICSNKCPFISVSQTMSCSKLFNENPYLYAKLVMEYEFKDTDIDWTKVKVDTPVLVIREKYDTVKRHFSSYSDGVVYVWSDGRTSFTTDRNELYDKERVYIVGNK